MINCDTSAEDPKQAVGLRMNFKTMIRIVIGAPLAFCLVFFESPQIYYCEWWACSVYVPFNWYQPILFLIASYFLGRGFWDICLTMFKPDEINNENGLPPPSDSGSQFFSPGGIHPIHYQFFDQLPGDG